MTMVQVMRRRGARPCPAGVALAVQRSTRRDGRAVGVESSEEGPTGR